MKLSINMIGNCNNEINIPNELLLTERKVSNICKVLQIIWQLRGNYEKQKYLKSLNQGDFLVNLNHF